MIPATLTTTASSKIVGGLSTKWRFLKPIGNRKCRVVFAGPHFQAGLSCIRELLVNNTSTTQHQHQNLNTNSKLKHAATTENHNLELIHAPTTADLMEYAPIADVALPFMESFDDDFLDKASNLRLIMQYGVGLERVNLKTASDLGIAVSNIPADGGSGNAPATAEHAVWLAMSLLRYHAVVNTTPATTTGNNMNLQERFQQRILGGLPVPRTLYNKRVTVVGYGAVGSTLCDYLVQFGAQVTVVRKRPWEQFSSSSDSSTGNDDSKFHKCNSLEEALPHTDILFLACTMTLETWHLMNSNTLGLLPQGALVVNVGRGPLVEYTSMMDGLTSQHIGGYASDVGIGHETKVSEPWDPTDPISKLPNVIFTPHVGGYCDYSYSTMGKSVLKAIYSVKQGKPPPVWVNKEEEYIE